MTAGRGSRRTRKRTRREKINSREYFEFSSRQLVTRSSRPPFIAVKLGNFIFQMFIVDVLKVGHSLGEVFFYTYKCEIY